MKEREPASFLPTHLPFSLPPIHWLQLQFGEPPVSLMSVIFLYLYEERGRRNHG
jgi:hypothetical protein